MVLECRVYMSIDMVSDILAPVPWTNEIMAMPGDRVPLADPTVA